MAQIVITSMFNKTVEIDSGAKNLLIGLQDHFIDWMHACGGKGRCTTCKLIVCEGMENFSELTEVEMSYRDKGLLKDDERLACQAKLQGDVRVSIGAENKFPHLKYSD